uniref:Uncharacterized protein n=1 Tax=Meloidogyne enterolobii TaxID=390850 RepID=A0A6V7XLH7_MELEN|nr:unnamed protein product [Meloidogyne enterolobii]
MVNECFFNFVTFVENFNFGIFFLILLMATKVLMSGIQPTGTMHIGNYLSEDYNRRILKIADLHSISTGFVPAKKLKEHICQTLAILLSTGVDPSRTIIVQQSRVPELTELMWILGTATTLVFFEYFLVKVAFTGSEKK